MIKTAFKFEEIDTGDLTTYNAEVKNTALDSYPTLMATITVDYMMGTQGFQSCLNNAYSLEKYPDAEPTWYTEFFLLGLFEVFKVSEWSQIKNQICIIAIKDALIYAIGHPIQDKWLCPKKLAEMLNDRKVAIAEKIHKEAYVQGLYDATHPGGPEAVNTYSSATRS